MPRVQCLAQPSTGLFDTEDEQRYFTLFSEKIAADLLPYFDPTTWRYTILQACAAEPSIRHAATAIGALGKTFEAAQSGRGRRPDVIHQRVPALGGPLSTAQRVRSRISRKEQIQEAALHHQYALEQYQKAIKQMQEIAYGNNIRTALITCIIIACFENLHGNQDSVSTQLESGIRLLQDWKNGERDATTYPIGFLSPAPDLIEDYLVQFFGRLEIQSMSFRDDRPPECHLSLKEEGKEVIQQMPSLLASINQARVYLDLIMRRMMHFTASMNYFKVSLTQYDKVSPTPLGGFQGPWMDSKVVPHTFRSPQHSISATCSEQQAYFVEQREYCQEQEALTSELDGWTAAFTPLLSRSIAAGGQECISALTLSVAATTSSISLRAAFVKTETEYDVFEPAFKTIVNQSALLLQTLEQCTPKTKPTLAFSFDLGVIPPLYLTAIKCRVSEIRRKALQLLTEYPRREGMWDSVTTAAIGKWVTEMDEGKVQMEDLCPKKTGSAKRVLRLIWWREKLR